MVRVKAIDKHLVSFLEFYIVKWAKEERRLRDGRPKKDDRVEDEEEMKRKDLLLMLMLLMLLQVLL